MTNEQFVSTLVIWEQANFSNIQIIEEDGILHFVGYTND